MAAAKTITLGLIEELEDVVTRLDYTHAMTSLIIEQKDYPTLPPTPTDGLAGTVRVCR